MADIEKLTVLIKRLQPASIKVIDAADDERMVAVPKTHRKRWAQVVGNIIGRPWIRCVFLDAKEHELGFFDNDAAASDLETITDDKSVAGALREERLLRLMIDAQKTALTYRDNETKDLLAGVTTMLGVAIDQCRANAQAMKELAGLYQAQVHVATDIAAMQAAAEHGGDMEQWLKALELAPDAIAKFAPLIQILMSRRALPAPPKKPGANGQPTNGVSK
jgi:hypothetical protein